MKKMVVLFLFIFSCSAVIADEEHHYKKCGKHEDKHVTKRGIKTACDLRAYALSPVGTKAYALFQGLVLGVKEASLQPHCSYTADDALIVSIVQSELVRDKKCSGLAVDKIKSILSNINIICY